jgi:hypothetical protein
MKIEVDTKFNIGDIVYVPEPHMIWLGTGEPSKVIGVRVECSFDNNGILNTKILYELSNGLFYCNETICFSTSEECQRWCRERNEEDGVL